VTELERIAARVDELVDRLDELVDRIERLDEAASLSRRQLLTTAEVADMLAVEASWVREHAEELGAIRLGSGERPRLRFDREKVAAYVAACSVGRRSDENECPAPAANPVRRGRRRSGTEIELLPVRGRK
jgi:hypothetical protein